MTGSSATDVLLFHSALAIAAFVVVVLVRLWVCRGANPDAPGDRLELAYVSDGPWHVLFTCLAELRRRGLVDSVSVQRGGGVAQVAGVPVPADASLLDLAVLAALPEYRYVPALLDDKDVLELVRGIGMLVVRRGWVISAETQSRMRWYALPGWLVAVWCLLQFGLTLPHFGEHGRALQALGLLGLGAFLLVATYLVVDVPPSTRAGRTALRRALARTRDHSDPEWETCLIAAGGAKEFWRDGADFAAHAGAEPAGEMGPMPHLITRRGDQEPGWMSRR